MHPLLLSQLASTRHTLPVRAVSSSNAARAEARSGNVPPTSSSRLVAIRQPQRRCRRRRRPAEGQRAPAVVFAAAASGSESERTSPSPSSSSPVSDRPAWRLGPYLAPPLSFLAAALEGAWHATLSSSSTSSSSSGGGLELVPLDPGVEYRDSADYEEEQQRDGEQEEESRNDFDGDGVDDVRSAVERIRREESARVKKLNKKRLVVENRIYSSRAFRKIHLELAARGDGLQVLHCVLFPRLSLPGGLPILSMDIVAAPAPSSPASESREKSETSSNISLAIIDPCPASLDLSLPGPYLDVVSSLQRECGVRATPRSSAPDWGREIFSDACVLERPGSDDVALKRFLRYALSLHRAHLKFSETLVSSSPPSSSSCTPESRAETAAAHARYRKKQLENGATRAVLAAAFGKEWADEYMAEVMFDVEGE